MHSLSTTPVARGGNATSGRVFRLAAIIRRREVADHPYAAARSDNRANLVASRFHAGRVLRALLPLLLLAGPSPARAHPIHSSYAEADYRPASGKLEIALRLFTDDAEVALSRRAGRKLSAARTPAAEFDAVLLAYVRTTLVVKTSRGDATTLEWVGRELSDAGQHLWVYVECALPGGPAGARLASRGLREAFSDQINSVRVRDHSTSPARQVTLLFVNDAAQAVNFGP